ncbi:MAG: dihydroorotase [Verrucomicrobiota bacterium]
MSEVIFFQGGRVASEMAAPEEADVIVEGGAILEVAPGLAIPEGCRVVDCRGKILLPALFDLNVHVREPGREDEETIRSGTEAAINGGVTGVVVMPNTHPAIDSAGMVRSIRNIASEEARIPVYPAGCITKNREGRELAEIGEMAAMGAVMITDDNAALEDARVLRRALEYAAGFGLIVTEHCDTPALTWRGAMNEGRVSYKLGLPGIPGCAEEICIARDCRMAKYTGARLHLQHISTADGVETIRRYKREGVPVTCEVTPHHLIFSEEDIGDFDTAYKMYPPLRTKADNAVLLEALEDGTIDVLVSDHAPHTDFEKRCSFDEAPFGITGLETALIALYHHFIDLGLLGWDTLVRAYSAAPRRILGLHETAIEPGMLANLVVFDPEGETQFTTEYFRSKSRNTPFLDKTLKGRIDLVMRGKEVLLDRSL